VAEKYRLQGAELAKKEQEQKRLLRPKNNENVPSLNGYQRYRSNANLDRYNSGRQDDSVGYQDSINSGSNVKRNRVGAVGHIKQNYSLGTGGAAIMNQGPALSSRL